MTIRRAFGLALFAAAAFAMPLTAQLAGDDEAGGTEIPEIGVTADVIYGHKVGMALTFDVLHPTGAPNGAGILYMVSGGWFSRWSPPERLAQRFGELRDRGFTVFAVRHGSSPRFAVPEAHADVDRALRFIKLHADEWGVDSDRLGVYGGSAGGHLSLMLGLAPDHGGPEIMDDGRSPAVITADEGDDAIAAGDDRVAAVVAYYPPVDLRTWVGPSERFPALNFPPELAADISPILFASPDDPPTLLIHGDADDLVPHDHSVRMYAEFQDQGVESDFITIEGGDHGFSVPDHRAEAEAAMIAWFEEHLN